MTFFAAELGVFSVVTATAGAAECAFFLFQLFIRQVSPTHDDGFENNL